MHWAFLMKCDRFEHPDAGDRFGGA
jgi:hypothetical protein